MYINKLKTSRILFLAVGWTISVLLGFVVAYTVGERGYWKVMVLIFFLFLMYVIWARDQGLFENCFYNSSVTSSILRGSYYVWQSVK